MMDERLLLATVPDTTRPRFWPPGLHPATALAQKQLRRFEEMGLEHEPAYLRCREELAAFEEGESIAKADYLLGHGGIRRRPPARPFDQERD